MSVLTILRKKTKQRQIALHPARQETPEVRAAYLEALSWPFTLSSSSPWHDRMLERFESLCDSLGEAVPAKMRARDFTVAEDSVDNALNVLGSAANRKLTALLLFDLNILAAPSGQLLPEIRDLLELVGNVLGMPAGGQRLISYGAEAIWKNSDLRSFVLQFICGQPDYWGADGELLDYIISHSPQGAALREYAAAVYGSRAWHLLNAGACDRAIEDFNAALCLERYNRQWLLGRGRCYTETGQCALALLDFSMILQHDAEDCQVYRYRAVAYERLGDWQSALADLEQAARLGAVFIDYKVHQLAGDLHARLEHYADAARCYETALALGGATGEIYNSLAYACFHQGQVIEAISAVNKAVEREPENPEWLDSRAEFYLALGDYEQVLADCRKALDLDASICRPYYLQGLVYEKLGRMAEAVECYRKFAASAEADHPDLAEVRMRLKDLEGLAS